MFAPASRPKTDEGGRTMGWFGFKRMLVFSALGAVMMGQTANAQLFRRGCDTCNTNVCNPSCGDNSCTDGTVPTEGDVDINTNSVASDFGSSSGPESIAPHMIGDYFSGLHYSSQGTVANNVRNFKFAENQSAAPIDRWYLNYSYYNDVGGFGGNGANISRWVAGNETTILDGDASLGFRVPFYYVDPGIDNTLSAGTANRAAFGDISLLFKYALINNGGDVLSSGVAYTIPNGSSTLGGVPSPAFNAPGPRHQGSVQPWVGGIRQLGGGVFFQGFSAFDIPIATGDSTIWLNDFQLGFVARTYQSSGITAIVPLMETHINSPWHRTLPGGQAYYSTLNVTMGVAFEINNASTLTLGLVCPIQDNHTFDYEFQCQYNMFNY